VADTADASARVGTVVGGKYALKSLIGTGGMGAVYEAENTWTRRPVALKLLHPEFANSREVVERFMQEAQLASQLRHPNIVDVLDMGQEESDNSLFIVQELLHGNDLRTLLDASGRLDAPTAIDIVLPLMGALALAHRRGVVHRDIKPENIYLAHDESGEVVPKLIDFGISKIVTASRADARNLTQTGTLVGTPNYMSPEQARGDAQVDGQTDVWSLGVVLYEMLSGSVPFDAPNQNVLMVKIIMEHAPRIESVAPDLQPALAELVHRALANDRASRFSDMSVFISAVLQSGLGGVELFERHRRSLAISAEMTGHFQALARARGVTTPAHVTPASTPSQPSVPPSAMPSLEAPTVPRLAALDTIDQEAPTSVSRRPGPAAIAVLRSSPESASLAAQHVDAPTMPRIAPPHGSVPTPTPIGWVQQTEEAQESTPAPAGTPRWVVAAAGVAALLLVVVAGVFWVQRHDPSVASQPTTATTPRSAAERPSPEPARAPVTPLAEAPVPAIVAIVPDASVAVPREPAHPPAAVAATRPVREPVSPRPIVQRHPTVRPVAPRPVVQRPPRNGTQNGAPILGL
jgi:serine/threonine protein kinase